MVAVVAISEAGQNATAAHAVKCYDMNSTKETNLLQQVTSKFKGSPLIMDAPLGTENSAPNLPKGPPGVPMR